MEKVLGASLLGIMEKWGGVPGPLKILDTPGT